MKTAFQIFLLIFFVISCNHPEGKKFERNQGVQSEINSSTTKESIINTIELEFQPNEWSENRNVLKMELENGVRYVWIEIRLRFIFDTGASDMTISATEALFLYKQGALRQEDILGTQQYQIADGSITEGNCNQFKNCANR